MKFLSVRDLRSKSAQVWRDLDQEKELVVTNNGRPIAVITGVSEDNLEESLAAWRRIRAERAITSMQESSLRKGLDSLSGRDIKDEIQKARAARRKRQA